MTQQEYKQKKRKCWEQFCKDNGIDQEVNISIFDAFDQIFDRAYALGKQEEDEEDTMIQGWVARDDGERWHERELHLFTRNKPERRKLMGDWLSRPSLTLDSNLFPDLTWESDPIEVEIIIKRKKK